MNKLRLFIFLFLLMSISPIQAKNNVVILGGAGGTDAFNQQFLSQVMEIERLLKANFGYAESDIHALVGSNSDSLNTNYLLSTKENITSLFRSLQDEKLDHLFVLFIGHGSYDGNWGKFNIPGPDLRDIDYKTLLDQMDVEKTVVINMASASGPFVDKLSRNDRIVISATRNGFEKNATKFPNYFIESLREQEEIDYNKDGMLSITELFISSRDKTIQHYSENKQLRPEHPLLDDDGDGFGTETPDLQQGDGVIASTLVLSQTSGIASQRVAHSAVASSEEQKAILEKIQHLQSRKTTLAEDEYYEQLEALMLELATLSTASENGESQ